MTFAEASAARVGVGVALELHDDLHCIEIAAPGGGLAGAADVLERLDTFAMRSGDVVVALFRGPVSGAPRRAARGRYVPREQVVALGDVVREGPMRTLTAAEIAGVCALLDEPAPAPPARGPAIVTAVDTVDATAGDVLTVIRDPARVLGKQFASDGTKRATVTVSFGLAVQRLVPDAAAMAAVLSEVADDPNAALINAAFPGIPVGEEFAIVSEKRLQDRQGLVGRAEQLGVHEIKHGGRTLKCVGRFKENTAPVRWMLLDRDIDPSTPKRFGDSLVFDGWLDAVAEIVPSVRDAPLVHAGSSSARVLSAGAPVGVGNGHLWVQVRDAADVERFRLAALVRAAERRMTWRKLNKHGKPGSLTTIFDTSTLIRGRLVFCGRPSAASPLEVRPQVVRVLGGRTPVDTATVTLPTRERIREVTRFAGVELDVVVKGNALSFIARDLTLDTELELADGEVVTVAEACGRLAGPGDKLRCQTPFRASDSLAAFLRVDSGGKPFVHDVGTGTTHWLSDVDAGSIAFDSLPDVPSAPPRPDAAAAGARPNWQLPRASTPEEWQRARPAPDCIVEDYLFADVALLIAPGGAGKTTLLMYEAIHIVLGLPLWGREIRRPGHVLVFSAEDTREMLIARLREMCMELMLDDDQIAKVREGVRIEDFPRGVRKLTCVRGEVVAPTAFVDDVIESAKGALLAMVVIDPAVSFGVGESRVNDNEQGLVEAARLLRTALNCCVRFVHHTGKQNARDRSADQYSGRNGSAFADGARMVAVMHSYRSGTADDEKAWRETTGEALAAGETGISLAVPKLSYAAPQDTLYIVRRGAARFDRIAVRKDVRIPAVVAAQERERVLAYVVEQFAVGRRLRKNAIEAWAAEARLPRARVRDAITLLLAEGRLVEEKLEPAPPSGARTFLRPVSVP